MGKIKGSLLSYTLFQKELLAAGAANGRSGRGFQRYTGRTLKSIRSKNPIQAPPAIGRRQLIPGSPP